MEYVLFGHTLHIYEVDPRFNRTHALLCSHRLTCEEEATDIRDAGDTAARPSYLDRHKECMPKPRNERKCSLKDSNSEKPIYTPLSLSVLKVCRQVYNEAALIPFAGNHFMLASQLASERLLSRLDFTQAKAIRSIGLVKEAASHEDLRLDTDHGWLLRENLPRLKRLIIFLELPPIWRLVCDPGEEQALQRNIMKFQHLPLEIVVIAPSRLSNRLHGGYVEDARR
ncbi:hypothetical protein LTR85_011085 [Meristemomyces frigidus]|nr:hypothetical protein LTR85_011085 [Meristemomyces frigidus]